MNITIKHVPTLLHEDTSIPIESSSRVVITFSKQQKKDDLNLLINGQIKYACLVEWIDKIIIEDK